MLESGDAASTEATMDVAATCTGRKVWLVCDMQTGECAGGSASEAEHHQVKMHAFLRYTALYASASEFLMQHQKQKWFRIGVAETSSWNIGLMQLWLVRCAAVVGAIMFTILQPR